MGDRSHGAVSLPSATVSAVKADLEGTELCGDERSSCSVPLALCGTYPVISKQWNCY